MDERIVPINNPGGPIITQRHAFRREILRCNAQDEWYGVPEAYHMYEKKLGDFISYSPLEAALAHVVLYTGRYNIYQKKFHYKARSGITYHRDIEFKEGMFHVR